MIHTLDSMAVVTSPAIDLLPEHISPISSRNYLSCSLHFWFVKLSGTLPSQTQDGVHVVPVRERMSAMERSHQMNRYRPGSIVPD